MFRSIWSRRRLSRPRPARSVPPVADTLEQRRLLSAGGATSPVVPLPVPPGGVSPHTLDLNEALKDDPTVATVRWAGHEALAKKGEWVAHFRGVRGTPAQQLAALTSLLRPAPPGIRVLDHLGSDGLVLLSAPEAATYDQLRGALRRLPGFDYVEPNAVQFQPARVPNDEYFPLLWGLDNTGQPTGAGFGLPDADIDAPEAWDLTTGSSDVVVGMIDTGIDYNHPDLAANMWHNPGEVAGDGIDNDANGYVDDYYGYDFANDDPDPMDDHWHGTHTAGTVGAVGDNAIGVTGVNWHVGLMALKFLNAYGYGTDADAVEAINYATMMKTRGVNLKLTSNSWGGGGYSQAIYDAIAANRDAGLLFVAAAGNYSSDTDYSANYPSGYDLDNIISVAASNNYDYRAWFSNYGATTVDLAAPGDTIGSTYPFGGYIYASGTSMATPHVAGVAALAWSLSPGATYQDVKDAVLGGVDVLPQWDGLVATGGRLNAAKTLALMGLTVSSSSPAANEVVTTRPTQFVLNLSDACDPASVDASDLAVNGVPATSFALTDADTITFSYATSPVTAQGLQHLTVAADSITGLSDGDGIKAYDRTFRYDALRMTVTSTVPADNAAVPVGLATVDVNVNEAIDAASVGTDDLVVSQGAVTAAARLDADTVRFTLDGVSDEGPLAVQVPAGAFADAYGNPSVAYQGQYTVDITTTPFPLPLNPVPPLGSMIYDPARQGQIGFAGDTDSFSMVLDPGQKVTVTMSPQLWDGPGVQAKLDLYRVDSGKRVLVGSTTAAPGADAYLEVLPTSGQLGGKAKPQTYIATAAGANGTTGYYTLHVILNAMTELESHQGGTPNDTPAAAQNLNAAFVPLHSSITSLTTDPRPERAGVIGYVYGDSDYFSYSLRAGESSTIAVAGQFPWTDLRVEVQDAAGNVLAQGRPSWNTNQVINSFKPQAAGTYYLRVFGYSDYSLLVTRNADFDTEPNNDLASAQDLNSSAVSSKQWSHGYAASWDPDFYRLPLAAGSTLEVQTLLPAHAAGQAANALDPMVRVYRSDGALVARDDNSDPDGRNARVRYKVPANAAGTYYVEVVASDATTSPTSGEYVVSIKQGTGALPPFTVLNTDIPDGLRTRNAPTSVTVNFNDVALLTTLQASDLTIDGVPASGMYGQNGQTVTFQLPPAVFTWPTSQGGNGHAYLVTSYATTWWDAEAQANAMGGHLVSINSAAENAFLQQTFFSGMHAFDVDWIGYTDNEAYGGTEYGDTHDHPYPPDGDKGLGWVWTSGEAATYSNWSEFEPNNWGGDQDYGTMNLYAGSGFPGNWDDDFGWVYRPGIIELPSATGWTPTDGPHTIRIAAGAVRDVQNTPITAYSNTFTLDLTPPRVIDVSTQQGGVVSEGDLTYTVRFSEPMNRDNILYNYPFNLFGKLRESYYWPSGVDLDASGTVLTLHYAGLPEDAYALTLFSGDYQFEDLAGWNLDGERPASPIPPNQSGDGFEGGNFAVDFAADGAPVALTPSPLPPESAQAAEASGSAAIVYDGDADDFTVHLDAGQTVSLAVKPRGGLIPTAVVRDPSGAVIASATAPGAGRQALLQSAHAASAGTYTVSVSGAGHALGLYDLELYVNAAIETEGRVVTSTRLLDYSAGFANPSGLTANGNASFVGGVAQLTPGELDRVGGFFTDSQLDVSAFNTTFTFHLLPGTTPMADGMMFVIQNAGPTALGGGGGGLGYAGIWPSVGIKFDIWNNAGEGINSTGLFVGGNFPVGFGSVDLGGTGIDLHSGHDFRVDVSYGGGAMVVTITDTATNASATQSYGINLAGAIGGTNAYVGFTGATGGLSARQEVLTWTFDGQVAQGNNTLADAQDLDGAFAPAPGGAGRATVVGGPDPSAGYGAAAVPFAFEDISATGATALQGYDDGIAYIPSGGAGFSFNFFGQTYPDVFVNSNGLITFNYPDYAFGNTDLQFYPNQPAVAAFWDDLDTYGGGAVLWEVRGAGDDQRLVLQWNNVHFLGDSDPLTFQAVLSEADGSIQLNYLDVGGRPGQTEGASATVGLTSGTGQSLLLAYNNGPNAYVGTGKSTRIAPAAAPADFYSFTAAAGDHVRLELGGGGPGATVDLLDSGGNVLASGSPGSGDVTSLLADFATASAGRYYVRVREATGPYTLVVTRGATLP